MDAHAATVRLESFGELLRRLRRAAGISQEELADRAGLSIEGVGALERGTRRAPQRDTLVMLSDALALSGRERLELEQAAERGRARSKTARFDAPEATHNLPLQLTSFVGRADETERLARLVEVNRLVTVLGSGGVGKTRMALEVAMGTVAAGVEVRFVDLAPLHHGSLIVGSVASVLGVRLPAANDSLQALAGALKSRRLLLLLDGFDHLIADATEVTRALLQQCPHLKILATSRERMGIMGEFVYRLPPLTNPSETLETIAEARRCGALELFVQRALAADAELTFTDEQTHLLVDVCRRLEGIPLAIELATAQLPPLGLDALHRRLETTLGAAPGVRGLPDRQRTMRDTIAWSYNLLIEPERSLLRRLGVFSGGCSLEAAEAVCPHGELETAHVAGLLAGLVDKSLVNAIIDGENMRYVLLDSTRAFAREQLDVAREQPALSRRHAEWLAEYGERGLRDFFSTPTVTWYGKFKLDLDNVRSAIDWALNSETNDDLLLAGWLVGRYRALWLIPSRFKELRQLVEVVLKRIDDELQPHLAVELLIALLSTLVGAERAVANDRLIAALRLIGDRLRLAKLLTKGALEDSCSSSSCDSIRRAREAIDEAWKIFVEEGTFGSSSVEAIRNLFSIAITRAQINAAGGDFTAARAHLQEASALAESGHDDVLRIATLCYRAELEFVAGNAALAAEVTAAAIERAGAIAYGLQLLAAALCIDASVRLSTSDIDGAEATARRALGVISDIGDDGLQLLLHQNLAGVAAGRGHPEVAARLLGSIEAWCASSGYRRSAFEEATYTLLQASLHNVLGAETETHVEDGRRLALNRAMEETLAEIDGHRA